MITTLVYQLIIISTNRSIRWDSYLKESIYEEKQGFDCQLQDLLNQKSSGNFIVFLLIDFCLIVKAGQCNDFNRFEFRQGTDMAILSFSNTQDVYSLHTSMPSKRVNIMSSTVSTPTVFPDIRTYTITSSEGNMRSWLLG